MCYTKSIENKLQKIIKLWRQRTMNNTKTNTNTNTELVTVKSQGCISTYGLNNGYGVDHIVFYLKAEQEPFAKTASGWLEANGTTPHNGTRITEIQIKPYTIHKHTDNEETIKKYMSKGGNFVITHGMNKYKEKTATLYIEVDNTNVKMEGGDITEVYNESVYNLTVTKRLLSETILNIAGVKVNVFEYVHEITEPINKEYIKEVERMKEVLKEAGIYLENTDVNKLVNAFKLEKREKTFTAEKLEEIKKIK